MLYNCTEGYVVFEGNKVGQGLGFRPGYGRESRTITLENGNYVTLYMVTTIAIYASNIKHCDTLQFFLQHNPF